MKGERKENRKEREHIGWLVGLGKKREEESM